MNVTVSCPACHLPTTVAEDDVLTAKITCARCGLAFAPLGPEPEPAPPEPAEPPATSQKIPGYGPRGRAPRPAAPRPRKPDGEKPGAEARFTRRAVAVGAVGVVGLLGLAAAGGVGLWAVRRANRGAAGGADDGDWQAYALPDAPEVTVEFPAPPVVADEPIDTVNERGAVVRSETLRVFVARNPRDGCDYVVRVGRVKLKPWVVFAGPPAGDVFEDWNGNAETTIRELTSLIRDSEPGPLEPTTCNGYPAVQQVVRTKGGGPYVVRAIGLDISDYVLFVRGPGAEPNSPSVRHFFNSFRHAHVPPPETDYRKPDGEALKPLATVQWFYWASFTPKCDGVYLIHRDSGPEQYIVRYDYPSFRPIARSGPIPHCNDGVIDNTGSNLYVSDYLFPPGTGQEVTFARLNLADLKRATPKGAAENVPCKLIVERRGLGCAMALSGDGRYLFYLHGAFRDRIGSNALTPADGTLYRIDTATMRCDRQRRVPRATGGLAVSPDGTSVYVVADRQRSSAAIWDIDPVRFVVRRELRPPKAAINHVQCTPSGLLILSGVEEYAHQLHPRRVRILAPDGTEHKPRLTARSRLAPLVTDGRLLVTQHVFGTLELWDLEGELKTMRPSRLGELKADTAVLSPDGRVLMLTNGKVYWLAGAGPLPEVDPSAKWKP